MTVPEIEAADMARMMKRLFSCRTASSYRGCSERSPRPWWATTPPATDSP